MIITQHAQLSPTFIAISRTCQSPNILVVKLDKSAAFEPARQHHRTIANAYQAARSVPNCFKHTPNFPVAAFAQGNFVPAVGTFPTARFYGCELGDAVFKRDAVKKPLFFLVS